MSEQAPTGQSTLEKERARLASEREKLDHKESILNREELFGKYDEGVTPAEGEMTYQQYLEQRPADGVYRDGAGFREAQSGQFSTQDAYEAQKGSIQDHYDKVGGLVNTGEYQPPNYEEMGVVQLAKEAAKARALGDTAGEEEVRAAVEHHLTMDAMKDDTETPEEAQARYEAEIARYDSLVERFENLRAKVTPAQSEQVQSAAQPESTSGPEAPEVKESAPAEKEVPTPEVHHNGEKVVIDNVFESPDGKKVVQIIDAEGKSKLVFENELSYVTPAPDNKAETPATPAEAPVQPEAVGSPAFVVDGKDEAEVVGQAPVDPAKGKELVPFVGSAGREVAVIEEEPQSRLDRIKNWFKKERAHYQEFGGKAYWGEKWTRAVQGIHDNTLDFGVTEEMSDEEKEHKRKRNRKVIIIGATAIGVTAIGFAIHGALNAHDVQHAAGGDIPTPGGSGSGTGEVASRVENPPLVTGAEVPGVDTVSAVPETSAVPVESFNIPSGMGGEQFFTNLGIDPSKWYANEQTLLAQFPSDFYPMSDGHVGIAHSGWLSQGAQDFINTLK